MRGGKVQLPPKMRCFYLLIFWFTGCRGVDAGAGFQPVLVLWLEVLQRPTYDQDEIDTWKREKKREKKKRKAIRETTSRCSSTSGRTKREREEFVLDDGDLPGRERAANLGSEPSGNLPPLEMAGGRYEPSRSQCREELGFGRNAGIYPSRPTVAAQRARPREHVLAKTPQAQMPGDLMWDRRPGAAL